MITKTVIEPEYVYITIPAEYICVYHRILLMLADFGEEMLKDCKASCTSKNSDVIDCFNMFNAAIAARKLGKDKLAETLIKYIKAKINQIYKGKDNSESFVFPIDENGQLMAFVSCGERPLFEINSDDMGLYEHKFENGFDEHFKMGEDDESTEDEGGVLTVELTPEYHTIGEEVRPCAEIVVKYNNNKLNINNIPHSFYFDDILVRNFADISNLTEGNHTFTVVVTYKGITKIDKKDLIYEIS